MQIILCKFKNVRKLIIGVYCYVSRAPPLVLLYFSKMMKGRVKMKKINLKDLYPLYYTADYFIEVSDEVAEQIVMADRYEEAYIRQVRRNKAYYSLDVGDGIEKDVLVHQMSPQEIYERKVRNEEVYAAISTLPEIQAKRIYAHFFLNISMSEIARIEGVKRQPVQRSICRGLKKISEILKNF